MLYQIIVLALSTGMRRGEIMNLRWENIDFPNNVIILQDTKNGEPRNVPLVGHAFKTIMQFRDSQIVDNLSELVFPAPTNPKKSYDFQSAWNAAIKRANIKNFRCHDLRHSAASLHAANGKNLHEIGKLLGHASLQTTARYAHLTHLHITEMIEELDHITFGEHL